MKSMRQRLTKTQWFVLFNSLVVVALYSTGNLRLTATYLVSDLIALLIVNTASLIASRRFNDWKK